MKKNTFLMALRLLLISVLLVSCAPMQKAVVTEDTLPTLRGRWSGWTTFNSFPSNNVRTTLQINTGKVPIQGWIILHQFPGNARAIFPAGLSDITADNSITLRFRNGEITGRGSILDTNGQNFLELTYYAEEEKQRFDGRFYFNGEKGSLTVTKD